MTRAALALVAIQLLTAGALAGETVRVSISGVVEFNLVRNGELGKIAPNDPVLLTFTVDSDDYLNSDFFPTRGYVIDQPSLVLTAGDATIGLGDPQPATPYFVIRDNDPAVDGFFLSYGPDNPVPLEIAQQGSFGPFGLGQSVTYSGSRLSSLDILDALGTYTFGYQSFHFGISDGPIDVCGFVLHEVNLALEACAADCNGDDAVNTLDVLCFLNLWNAGDPAADCNGDGSINTLDVLCFLNLWNAGC